MKIRTAVAGLTTGLALSAAPLVVPASTPVLAPVESEAVALALYLDKDSKRPITVYEKHGCGGDSDVVWPGQWENSQAVSFVAAAWIPAGAVKMNGVKKTVPKAYCHNFWGMVVQVTVQTY